jgi:hypothetical protein
MKIRANYVSNSSSTSFCIVGVVVSDDDFDIDSKNLRTFLVSDEGWNEDEVDEMDAPTVIDSLYSHLYGDRFKSMFGDISVVRGIENYNSDCVIIGLDIDGMQDDETLGQFKDKVCEQLKNIGFTGDRGNISIYVDGGYGE